VGASVRLIAASTTTLSDNSFILSLPLYRIVFYFAASALSSRLADKHAFPEILGPFINKSRLA
jgi:hypothetical protein